jgi:hypothetical protein
VALVFEVNGAHRNGLLAQANLQIVLDKRQLLQPTDLCYLDAKVIILPKQQAALDTPGLDAALQRSLLEAWAMAANVSTGVLASDIDRSALTMMLRTLGMNCQSRGPDDGRRAHALPPPAPVRLTSTRSAGPVPNGTDVIDLTLPCALIKDIEEAGWAAEGADRVDVPQTAAARNVNDALFRGAKTTTVGFFGWFVRTVAIKPWRSNPVVEMPASPTGATLVVCVCPVWNAHRTGPWRLRILRRWPSPTQAASTCLAPATAALRRRGYR